MTNETAELTVENLNNHNRSLNPGPYGYVIGMGYQPNVKRYIFKAVHRYIDGTTRDVFMYEDDDGDAWTIYTDFHCIHYDD
jgi:hypothetical protein